MFDWNDARFFLAVAESGSTLAAGRALRVSQTTVARRIAALETALGLALFDKRRAGYVLTPAGHALLTDARGVQASALALADSAAAQKTRGRRHSPVDGGREFHRLPPAADAARTARSLSGHRD